MYKDNILDMLNGLSLLDSKINHRALKGVSELYLYDPIPDITCVIHLFELYLEGLSQP